MWMPHNKLQRSTLKSTSLSSKMYSLISIWTRLSEAEVAKPICSITCRHHLVFIVHLMLFVSVNICSGPKEDKLLLSGLHVVCDLFCKSCHSVIGWKYVTQSVYIVHFGLKNTFT